jgi:glutamine amidotransferase
MATRVVVVDYGIGNVFSVCHALRHAGAEPVLSSDTDEVARAERLVLPGVGAFGRAMAELRDRALVEPVLSFVRTGRPFLGLCVGMQMLMDRSEELGHHEGLGLLAGSVEKIPSRTIDGMPMRVPHIGWTELKPSSTVTPTRWAQSVLGDIEAGRSAFYFVHSYAVHPLDPRMALAEVDYGGWPITATVTHENVTGVQFHPERSGPAGQKLLRRYLSA